MNKNLTVPLLAGLLLFVVVGTTLVIYWPGLSGEFILDDTHNLEPLGQYLDEKASTRLSRFVFSGHSGPLGRPLSMASFLINDNYWPADPRLFKYTNVLIHTLVGTLVFWLTILIFQIDRTFTQRRTYFIGLCVAAIWLLHPFNVSSVLYVIQRMAQLSGLFVILGVIGYIKGRLLSSSKPVRGLIVMSLSVGGPGLLGILSKETAVLLPLMLLVVEYTLLRGNNISVPPGWRPWSILFLFTPVGLLVAWHFFQLPDILKKYNFRPFSLTERLLTQSRVLWDYLGNILIPRRLGTGVLHDDFVISHSLFDPMTTVFAVLALGTIVCAALFYRRRAPVFSFAVLWFVAAHSLEGGILQLEIYFEHRNYVAMIGPLVGLGFAILWLVKKVGDLAYVVAAIFIGVCGLATWQNTTLWGDTLLMSEIWAEEHPSSLRAQQNSANQWALRGHIDKANQRIEQLLSFHPEHTSAQIELFIVPCVTGKSPTPAELESLYAVLRKGKPDFAAPQAIQVIRELKRSGNCRGIEEEQIDDMINALLDNPATLSNSDITGHLRYALAQRYVEQGELNKAIKMLSETLSHYRSVDVALFKTNLHVAQREFDDAVESIALAREIDKHRIFGFPMHKDRIDSWERHITNVMEKYEPNVDQ